MVAENFAFDIGIIARNDKNHKDFYNIIFGVHALIFKTSRILFQVQKIIIISSSKDQSKPTI